MCEALNLVSKRTTHLEGPYALEQPNSVMHYMQVKMMRMSQQNLRRERCAGHVEGQELKLCGEVTEQSQAGAGKACDKTDSCPESKGPCSSS